MQYCVVVVIFSITTILGGPALKYGSTPIPMSIDGEVSTPFIDLESKIKERETSTDFAKSESNDHMKHSSDIPLSDDENERFWSRRPQDKMLMDMWSSPMPLQDVSDHVS